MPHLRVCVCVCVVAGGGGVSVKVSEWQGRRRTQRMQVWFCGILLLPSAAAAQHPHTRAPSVPMQHCRHSPVPLPSKELSQEDLPRLHRRHLAQAVRVAHLELPLIAGGAAAAAGSIHSRLSAGTAALCCSYMWHRHTAPHTHHQAVLCSCTATTAAGKGLDGGTRPDKRM